MVTEPADPAEFVQVPLAVLLLVKVIVYWNQAVQPSDTGLVARRVNEEPLALPVMIQGSVQGTCANPEMLPDCASDIDHW
jgi:hypothetical protein